MGSMAKAAGRAGEQAQQRLAYEFRGLNPMQNLQLGAMVPPAEGGMVPASFAKNVWAAMSGHPSYQPGVQDILSRAVNNPGSLLRKSEVGDQMMNDYIDAAAPDATDIPPWMGRGNDQGRWLQSGRPYPESPLDAQPLMEQVGGHPDPSSPWQRMALQEHINRAGPVNGALTGQFLRNLYLQRARLPGSPTGY